MTKLSYLLAATAALVIATPTFAQDAPKAGVTINQGSGSAPTGEVKRDEGRSQEGRGDMRREGDRERGRMDVRTERRDGDRGGIRVDRRESRYGVRVEADDRYRGERRWHRARAERLVVVHRRHRHHRHY